MPEDTTHSGCTVLGSIKSYGKASLLNKIQNVCHYDLSYLFISILLLLKLKTPNRTSKVFVGTTVYPHLQTLPSGVLFVLSQYGHPMLYNKDFLAAK